MNLDRDFPELDDVVVYLPAARNTASGVKPTACNRKQHPRTLQACGCRPYLWKAA